MLCRHRVEFVITGGIAAVLQGGELPAGDVDRIYPIGEDNLGRLAAALKELNAESRQHPGLETDDLAALLSARTCGAGAPGMGIST